MKTLKAAQFTDNTGLVYIGYKVEHHNIDEYLIQLKAHLGVESYTRYRRAQMDRDGNSFHITLINPFEYAQMKPIDVTNIPSVVFSFEGVGRASHLASSTYFVVANSIQAQQIRQQLGLKVKDFHVTLGFDPQDVFGVKKDCSSLLYRPCN